MGKDNLTSEPLPEFLTVIEKLRSEHGCPWDKKQTPATIKKYLLEETAELAEAIDQDDAGHILEETGDLLYILAMLCQMFKERDVFCFDDALRTITQKMIRRHPHVFAGVPVGDEEALRKQWQDIKQRERCP